MTYNFSSTPNGGLEAVIDDNCGISKFYTIASALTDELNVKFLNQVDDAESVYWDFQHEKNFFTLRYCIFNGVSVVLEKQHVPKKADPHSLLNKFLQSFTDLMG